MNSRAKRALDVCGAAFALLLLTPVFAIIAFAIKLDSRGPVLYRALRIGRDGRPFRMFKFRTMVVDADRLGGPSTSADDPRLTRVGTCLRRYKLDEFPQLFNVLEGSMSLVGPRPEVSRYVEMYSMEERRILSVRPGITDYASLQFSNEAEILKGAVDPEQAYMQLIRPKKIRLALHYVDNWSLAVDFQILWLTLRTLAGRPAKPKSSRPDYSLVTERPEVDMTAEAREMMASRYRWAGDYAKGKRVLEIGCGAGQGLTYLCQEATLAVGGDPSASLLGIARQQSKAASLVGLDAHALPFRAASFDVVAIFEAIYYFESPPKVLLECNRVLGTAGALLISTANKQRPGFSPSPFSHRYFSPEELEHLLVAAGFRPSLFGGFPLQSESTKDRLVTAAARAVSAMHMVPSTMKGRAKLKRLLHARLEPMPPIEEFPPAQSPVPLNGSSPEEHKVIYALGKLPL